MPDNGHAGGNGIPAADLRDWRAALAAALPSGTGSVALDAATKNVVVVVQWDDSRATGDVGADESRRKVGLTTQQVTIATHL